MTVRNGSYPDPALAGAHAAFFSHWRVGTPERQQAAVDAIDAAWLKRPWPGEWLLGYHVYASTDGELLLHYSQWTEQSAHGGYVGRGQRDERVAEIDAAVPGIERFGLTPTSRYRSVSRRNAEPGDGPHRGSGGEHGPQLGGEPGCLVLVDVTFDGPDEERQRAWVDAVLEALADDSAPHPGGLSAHFHLSSDGTRVLNYAEWTDEQAHLDALAAPGDGAGGPTAAWRRVQEFPGLTGSTVRRYRLATSLRPH